MLLLPCLSRLGSPKSETRRTRWDVAAWPRQVLGYLCSFWARRVREDLVEGLLRAQRAAQARPVLRAGVVGEVLDLRALHVFILLEGAAARGIAGVRVEEAERVRARGDRLAQGSALW